MIWSEVSLNHAVKNYKLGKDPQDNDSEVKAKQLVFLHEMHHMTERSYWRRAWITQKVTAASDVQLWSGDMSLAYDIVAYNVSEMESLRIVSPTPAARSPSESDLAEIKVSAGGADPSVRSPSRQLSYKVHKGHNSDS